MSNKISKQTQLRKAARRLFQTRDGEQVLKALEARTISRASWPASQTDGQAMALMMAMREGENNLYRYLVSLTRAEEENHGK